MSKGLGVRYHLNKIKDVQVKDALSVFPMTAALAVSALSKEKYKETWAVCERADEACDNGYHFYRYCRTEHPEQPCCYVINTKSRDYGKVKAYGNIVRFGSIEHWLLYFNARYLISSQSFKPNGYVCTLFERLGLFKPSHVFLQHGITINKADFILASHRPNTKFFITGAKPEHEFVKKYFGYPDGTIRLTGFARFDALHDFKTVKHRILIMPTWRKWLKLRSEAHSEADSNLLTSEYFVRWKGFLNSEKFIRLIREYNLEVIFMPHPNMRSLLNISEMINDSIHDAAEYSEDLQGLMKSSEMLITDYSSVFFDMVYMKKPILFYQFDYEKFRKYHYREGWFRYNDTAFGNSCSNADQLLAGLKEIIQNDYKVDAAYLKEHDQTFDLYDTSNCRRIFELLKKS